MRRWIVYAAVLGWATQVEATIQITNSMRLKDDEKTYAVVIDCPQRNASGKNAASFGGSEDGKIKADACGKCLLDANWGTFIRYPYDVHIKGMMLDENDKPVENQLVHFFLPNGWTVKTRTASTGFFRVILGATDERKSKTPLTMDIGTHRIKTGTKIPYYAFFILPEDFTPCGTSKKPGTAGKTADEAK
jgi:hypothetical protein